jgi:hypothetical protein
VAQPASAPKADPAPDFATDPAGFIRHNFDSLNQTLQQVSQRIQQVEAGNTKLSHAQQQAQAVAELDAWGSAQEAAFARDVPDYQSAVAHLAAARTAQLQAIGVDAPEQIRAAIISDVRGLAHRAREGQRNFGEMLYELAKANGYRQSAAAPPATAAAQPAARVAPVAENAAERLIRGQEMATTIGATGGAPSGEVSVQRIASMSDADFDAYYASVKKRGASALRNVFGE